MYTQGFNFVHTVQVSFSLVVDLHLLYAGWQILSGRDEKITERFTQAVPELHAATALSFLWSGPVPVN